MPDDLKHPKLLHGCIVCGYAFTAAEYFAFVRKLQEAHIDFYVTQVGRGDYYRFSFRLEDVAWFMPFDPSGVNKSPIKLPTVVE